MTDKILENAKKWYLEGNSLRKTVKLIFQKYGIKVGASTLRKTLKEIVRTNTRNLNERLIIKLYTKHVLSQSKLARTYRVSIKTIRKILVKNNVKIRNNEESKRMLTRYIKHPFDGTSEETAYLIGLYLGDLYVRRMTKFIIRVSVSSTKEVFIKLLRNLFQKYGRIRCYNYDKTYTFIVDLDNSFEFLLNARENKNIIKTFEDHEFLYFLAGFIDAEGSLFKVKDRKWLRYFVRIYNSDLKLLEAIKERLEAMKIRCKLKLRWVAGTTRIKNGKKIIATKNGYIPYLGSIQVLGNLSGLAEQGDLVRKLMVSVSPNPVTRPATIRFALPRITSGSDNAEAKIRIYDASGRLVRTLPVAGNGNQVGAISWDGKLERGTPAPAGIYFLELCHGDAATTAKFVMVR